MRQRVRIDKSIPNEGALDFSHLLDAPAGKHGFVRVQGGHLYFEDGLRAKFYGFNFPARASMPDHETAERLAARLATLGANVVRLHAADVMPGPKGWTANPESPLLDYASGSSRNFHPEGLDRLDYFFCQLKKRGIYIHLDLYVARVFLEGDDLDYPEPIPAHCKGISHYNQRLIELQKEYAKELLTHVNPYTGLSYADEPAVMAVEIANDSIYGLAGAVFGTEEEANKVARQMKTGTVYVNAGQWDVASPFGGYKQSGLGREGGVEGYEEFLEVKTIYDR